MWEKIADTLNKFIVPKFRVDKRSVRDHVGILVYKNEKKLLAEEKATGITSDEPTELENLLDMIIALEESGEAELQETASRKRQYDRAKAEDFRLKAMEKLSETKKRGSSEDESDDKPKRQPRSGGDAIEQNTNKAFIGLSKMMPWLFLRKNRRRERAVCSRVVLHRDRDLNFTFRAQTTAFYRSSPLSATAF